MGNSSSSKIAVAVIFIVIIPLVLLFLLIKPVSISGTSMEPNYINGDRYIALKHIQKLMSPQRGDVIIFTIPDNEDYIFTSRIVGLPGEEVRIENGSVYIDDSALTEEYLDPEVKTETQPAMSMEETSATTGVIVPSGTVDVSEEGESAIVPEGRYFVLCDNREKAIDSRNYGFIEKSGIIGKLVFQY